MYISLYKKVFAVCKSRNGEQYLNEVPVPKNDQYKHMTVLSCIESNEKHGLSYVCNGDFNSLKIESN